MPKPQTTSQALQAYSRQQRVGQLANRRPQTAHPAERPASTWIGTLVEMATRWVACHAPEVPAGELHREAMALVGDFLSLAPRGPVPYHSYRERFQDYLDGAAPPLDDPGN